MPLFIDHITCILFLGPWTYKMMPTCQLAIWQKLCIMDGWCNLAKTIIDLYDKTIDDLN
jgi:hypothetical protein